MEATPDRRKPTAFKEMTLGRKCWVKWVVTKPDLRYAFEFRPATVIDQWTPEFSRGSVRIRFDDTGGEMTYRTLVDILVERKPKKKRRISI